MIAISTTVDGTVTDAVTYFAIGGNTNPPCDPGEVIADAAADTAIVDDSKVDCFGWTTERPTVGEDEYLWTCNKLTLTDGSTKWTEPVLVTDNYTRTRVASLAITSDSIIASVSDLQSTVDGNYSSLSSEITQLADSIEMCVTADEETGYLRLGTGSDGTVKFTIDADNITLDETGDLTLTGAITAGKGSVIGGWKVSDEKIYGTTEDGTTVAVMQISGLTQDTAYVFAAGPSEDGHSSYATCPFRVNKVGGMWVDEVVVANNLVAGGYISSGGDITAGEALVANNGTDSGGIYCKNSGGTNIRVTWMSSNNNIGFGHESYDTYIWGKNIYANSIPVPEVQHGSVTITPSAANTATGVAVKFDYTFSGTPDVTLAAATSEPSYCNVGVTDPSSTGCTIYLTRTNTTETTVRWIAAH